MPNKNHIGHKLSAGCLTASFALGLMAPSVSAQPEYAVADIGQMLGETLSSVNDINENGDAVGDAFVSGVGFRPFVYMFEHGAFYLPDIAPFVEAAPVAVTDRDANGEILIAGTAGELGLDAQWSAARLVYWRVSTVTGQVIETVDVGLLPGFDWAFAADMNNAGTIVGYAQMPGIGGSTEPIVYDIATAQLSAFSFPALPAAINNAGQVAGGTFVGDLAGNSTDLGIPEPANSVGATISSINDSGWVSAGLLRAFTDGNGRRVRGAAIHDGAWDVIWSNSAFDTAGGINENGDIVGLLGAGAAIREVVYLKAENQLLFINDLFTPTQPFFIDGVSDINANRQIGSAFPAAVLTPLGTMIIPGDVNGDAAVDFTDLCAWLNNPIDLDSDGDADADDEQWLVDRLASLGLVVEDCNANGVPDPCDISGGVSADCNANGVPDECEPDCDGNGVPDECESDCNANGVPDACDIASGFSDDCNNNGIPDECDVADTVTAGVTYNPPQLLLPDSTFTDSVLVTDTGTIADVDFAIDLSFRIGEVTIILHHAGVSAVLVDQPGPAPLGFTNLGYNIVLDDEGTGGNIQTVGEPISEFDPITSPPSYRPNEPLSVFDGLPRDGVWTLEFIGGFPQTFDPGLDSWSVSVTDQAVDPGDCSCPADLNGDGMLDIADVVEFLRAFGQGDAAADLAAPFGVWDIVDVVEFLRIFGAGCP